MVKISQQSTSSSKAFLKQELPSIQEDRQQLHPSQQQEEESPSANSTNSTTTPEHHPQESNKETEKKDDDEINKLKDELESSPLWSGANAGWSLTWPIWHMLPHHERKALAKQYGYKSIGEFEEYMSFQQAMGDSEEKPTVPLGNDASPPTLSSLSTQKPYANEAIYPKQQQHHHLDDDEKPAANTSEEDEDEDEDRENDNDKDEEDNTSYAKDEETEVDNQPNPGSASGLPVEELIKLGGKLLVLHDELLHRIFSFLPVDAYGTLALVSPHWKHLTRTEPVYRRLCERLYLNQSKRRQLHLNRFAGSYRRMLEVRPRVRAAGGCYVLKYSQIKTVQRDMWTEVPVGAVLESIYYRYFYFQEDGRVLYALTSAHPHEMFKRLLKLVLHKDAVDKAAVWGRFVVQHRKCTIIAKQEHTSVRFDLTIEVESSFGRFAALTMDSHYSSKSANFEKWSHDRVEYTVPSEISRFIKDPRL